VLARHGVASLIAAISPFAQARQQVRQLAENEGIPFVEVYVQTTLDAVIQRDVKGLYRRALAGEIAHFTGVSDPYEPPADPEVTVDSSAETEQASLERVIAALRSRGLMRP
jgi:adenylylsulfate kinase